MPFKSEKQRRYLWANEPEIARDWTDTYGSRIKKKNGGITQAGVLNYKDSDMVTVPKDWKSSPDHPDTQLAYITKAEKDLLVKKDLHNSLKGKVNRGPGGVMSLNGWGTKDAQGNEIGMSGVATSAAETGGGSGTDAKELEIESQRVRRGPDLPPGVVDQNILDYRKGFVEARGDPRASDTEDRKSIKDKYSKWYNTKQTAHYKKKQLERVLSKLKVGGFDVTGLETYEDIKDFIDNLTPDQMAETMATLKDKKGNLVYTPKQLEEFAKDKYITQSPTMNMPGVFGWLDKPALDKQELYADLDKYSEIDTWQPSDPKEADWLEQMKYFSPTQYANYMQMDFNPRTKKFTERKDDGYGGVPGAVPHGDVPLWQQKGFNTEAEYLASLQPATGITGASTSPFQQSLTNTGATASTLSPYYVGANPTAANLAWGQQFNVDPRTMYRTTWADGGPIRQRYFLGKLVKKIGRAAKKVIKSPIGKAALIGGLGYWGLGKMGGIQGLRTMAGEDNWKGNILKSMLMQKDDPTKFSPWKLGIGALSLSPFLMGGKEEEPDQAFDYDAAKNAYLNEIMKIRRDAMAGTLDPSQFVYQGVKDGGRIGYNEGGLEDPMLVEEYKKYIFEMEEMGLQPMSFEEFKRQAVAGMASGGRAGYYAGGQSIPSGNTMIDASKTEMQDRLGGITDVMKTADLYRQGDIGQMYMAEGGPTQEAGIMDLDGVEKDYRETGGFVPIGKEEKADDVPARLSLNEFVMTADAVRGMGDGDIDQGAERMEDLMETLEVKGKKNQGAQDMFEVSERLSAVV